MSIKGFVVIIIIIIIVVVVIAEKIAKPLTNIAYRMSLFFANKIFILHKIVHHNGYDEVDVYLTTTLPASFTNLPLGLSQRS